METKHNFDHKPKAENTGLEVSAKNYEKATETLSIIAEEILGLHIPEKTIQDWKILLRSVRIVDDRLDHISEKEEREILQGKIVGCLRGDTIDFSEDQDLEKAMSSVRDLATSLEDDQRQFFISALLRILKVTEKIKNEEDPHNLVDLRRLEGQITARIFLPFIPEEFRKSENYPKLVHALTRLGRAANSFDSFVDLPSDYENQQTKVKPNLVNRTLFLGAVMSDGLSMIKDTGLLKNLINKLLVNIRYTAKNNSEKTLDNSVE